MYVQRYIRHLPAAGEVGRYEPADDPFKHIPERY
jgi:hypothetical protein